MTVDQERHTEVYKLYRQCVLGHAKINVSDNRDMGRGPSMKLGAVNPRSATKSSATLMHINTGNGTRIQSSTQNNAIVVSVDPKLVDLGSLTCDESATEFEHVRWLYGATAGECVLVNGASRVGMMQQLVLDEQLMGVEELRKAIALEESSTTPDQEKIENHKRILAMGNDCLRREGQWLALFIDASECPPVQGESSHSELNPSLTSTGMLANNEHGHEVLMMYAANSKTGHRPDSADDSLALVAQVMNLSDDARHESILDTLIATSISEHRSNSGLSPVLRDTNLMRMVARTGTFHGAIDQGLLTVKYLHSWQAMLSGVRGLAAGSLAPLR